MPWIGVDDALAHVDSTAVAAAVKELSVSETRKTYKQRLQALGRCGSCEGVINEMTGECRCSS